MVGRNWFLCFLVFYVHDSTKLAETYARRGNFYGKRKGGKVNGFWYVLHTNLTKKSLKIIATKKSVCEGVLICIAMYVRRSYILLRTYIPLDVDICL